MFNTIHVTQGYERGIGLEVFFKAFLCLNKSYQSKFVLHAFEDSIQKTLISIKVPFKIFNDKVSLSNSTIRLCKPNLTSTETTSSLFSALEKIKDNDLLITLPSRKDQIFLNDKQLNGYTEFFRQHFELQNISMNFVGPKDNVLLLTDHIDIDDISRTLNHDYIVSKIKTTLDQFPTQINEVILSGINPHCGEDGLISKTDDVLNRVVETLKINYPNHSITGPLPADTLHFHKFHQKQLTIYASHDQGLAPFKLANGLVGINLSLGLPFIRVSVDHGTADALYAKNESNYQGMLYLLNEVKKWT